MKYLSRALLLVCLISLRVVAEDPVIIDVWPNTPPGETKTLGPEAICLSQGGPGGGQACHSIGQCIPTANHDLSTST